MTKSLTMVSDARPLRLHCAPFGILVLAALVASGIETAAAVSAARCAGTVYVANTPEGTVSVIDTSTDKVIATIPVGKVPAIPIFTRDGKRAYVNNSGDGTISQLDVVHHRAIRTIPLPDGLTGSGFALSPDGWRAVLTKLGDPGYAVIVDLKTGHASKPITVGNGSERVAIAPDGKRAYVTDGNPKGDGTVTIIDLAKATVVKTIPVGKYPFNLIVMPDGRTVYVANIFGSSISVIDTRSDTVVETIPTAPFPNGLALAPDGRTIYITNFTTGAMQVLDLATRMASVPVHTSANPSYLALSANGEQAYYVHPLGNTVSVVDTKTLGLASTIVVGKAPTAIGACPFPGAVRTVAAGQPAKPASAPLSGTQRLSVETTGIGDLMSNAAARAVLMKHIPTIVGNDQIAAAGSLTLRMLRDMSSDRISEAALKDIDADLARIPGP
jgi:YVTN family beta-propeller protein